jgi:prophage antirepressor-like protein
MNKEVINYKINNTHNIEVILEDETVWLSQTQMAELFDSSKQNISLHINNVFKENELAEISVVKDSLTTASDGKKYRVKYYNLDVIISVGYRVKSNRGTQFRIWATKVLKEYLLKGYLFQHRLEKLEERVMQHETQIKEIIEHSLPPKQGIFYDGQVFDAYLFATSLVRKANKSIILIDNYIDERVLDIFSKRSQGTIAKIYTNEKNSRVKLDMDKYNSQYPAIELFFVNKSHDRFLIIDNKEIYLIGASLKDLGKKWFAFSKIDIDIEYLLQKLDMK